MTLIQREDLENRRIRLTIAIDREAWQASLGRMYQQNKAFFPVEGYAPGAAPREALEAAYGQDVLYQEAVNDTFPAALVEAIQSQQLQIAGTPALEVGTIGPEGYTFHATVELYPEVKLGAYKGLRAPRENVELSDDDVTAALEEYRRAHLREIPQQRAAMGDEVTLDFEGFVDGVAFAGGKGENYPLVLGSGTFIPGFEEQLAGISVGEQRDVHVTFPQAYVPELAGKDAVFQVTARQILRRELPELDDAFAVSQGFDDIAQLRRQVMADALAAKEAQAQGAYSDALIQQVLAGMEVEIPDSMVENQLQGILGELERQLAAQGMELQAYLEAAGLQMDDLRQHARETALQGARYELAMTEIARLEGIEITDEELEQEYRRISGQSGMDLTQLRQQLPEPRLRHDMKLARARALVVESAAQN